MAILYGYFRVQNPEARDEFLIALISLPSTIAYPTVVL